MICWGILFFGASLLAQETAANTVSKGEQDLGDCLLNTATNFNIIPDSTWDQDLEEQTEKWIENLENNKCRKANEYNDSHAFCSSHGSWEKVTRNTPV